MTDPTPVNQLIVESTAGVEAPPQQGSVDVVAPKWAVHGQSSDRIGARLLGAAVLAGIAVWLAASPLAVALPGEYSSVALTDSLSKAASVAVDAAVARQQSAVDAQADAEAMQRIALEDKQVAIAAIAPARLALAEARSTGQGEPRARTDLRTARASRAEAKQRVRTAGRAIRRAAADLDEAAAQEDVALDTLAASVVPHSTDSDRVRVVAFAGLALLSLLGAIVLLAPRTETSLSYNLRRGPLPTASAASSADPPATTMPPTPSQGGTVPKSSFVAREPVVTQAGLTAAALVAGLFGIQLTEGTAEAIINVLLPVLPIVGGFLARRQVTAGANLPTKPAGT